MEIDEANDEEVDERISTPSETKLPKGPQHRRRERLDEIAVAKRRLSRCDGE